MPFLVIRVSLPGDARSFLLLVLHRERDLLGVAGVQDRREEARLRLLARVPRHPVDAPGRLVESVPGLVGLDGVVVQGVLVLALQDVAEDRPGMAVRRALLPG